jgi:23S rRNA pseudouridine1911/1915/1917 synthase
VSIRGSNLFEVLGEDEEFLAINKPAGLVCHPTKGDEYSSLISRVRLYLGAGTEAHLINRLDRETSGIVIVAKSAQASAGLRAVWESRQVEKEYLAIVHGAMKRESLVISAPLGKDERSAVAIKDTVLEGGAPSQTRVGVVKRFARDGKEFSLLRVQLLTGRKHQIRIHLSHIGHSIVGDKLYGFDERIYLDFVSGRLSDEQRRILMTENHALHAGLVSFDWRGIRRTFRCAPEPWFRDFAGLKIFS